MHAWHDVSPGKEVPRDFQAVIEIPLGSNVKGSRPPPWQDWLGPSRRLAVQMTSAKKFEGFGRMVPSRD